MIKLDAPLIIDAACPRCAASLHAEGWVIPGMRPMARARCLGCDGRWLVDLAVGQALYSPMLLDANAGEVIDVWRVPWFADWLRAGYRERGAPSPVLSVHRHRPVTRAVVLLDCLDTLYGHALLKLLSAQRYLDSDDLDIVVIVQPMFAALVPDGVAETWVVDISLRAGIIWNDGLADAIAAECARFHGLALAQLPPHPHPSTFDIERFSRVPPFEVPQWRWSTPAVTFIWRDDRQWRPRHRRQRHAVLSFFDALAEAVPGLDAAVAGIGSPGNLPARITDLRSPAPNADCERSWLARYAASHCVVGVHGSGLLLPSAHAGSTIEIAHPAHAGNYLQGVLFNGSDARDLMFRMRFVDPDVRPSALAGLVAEIILRYPDFAALMSPDADRGSDVRL